MCLAGVGLSTIGSNRTVNRATIARIRMKEGFMTGRMLVRLCGKAAVVLLIAVVAGFAMMGCTAPQTAIDKEGAAGPVMSAPPLVVSAKEAYEFIQKNRGNADFVILDVRTPAEFETGHIEGAVNISFPSGVFEDEIGKLDKSKTYLVYCRTGRRSAAAVDVMRRHQFQKLMRFEGDILKWKSEGLPLVK